jgi:hypothetical protein
MGADAALLDLPNDERPRGPFHQSTHSKKCRCLDELEEELLDRVNQAHILVRGSAMPAWQTFG